MFFVLSLLLNALPAHAGGNGSSRGGGNSIVCFKDQTIAEGLTVLDQATGVPTFYKTIPNEDIDKIDTIMSFDLYLVSGAGGRARRPLIQMTGKPGSTLDDEYEWYGRRFDGFYSTVHYFLDWYAKELPFSDATPYEHGLNPVYDIPDIGLLPPNCILATTFVQTGTDDSAAWGFDKRLFYHAKQSKLSQVVFLLHERLYLKARTEKDATDSAFVTQVVGDILNPKITFTRMLSDWLKIDSHNQLGIFAKADVDWRPIAFLNEMCSTLLNANRIEGKASALVLYQTSYQNKLLNMTELPIDYRKQIDQNAFDFFSGKIGHFDFNQFDIMDWKIPLPNGYSVSDAFLLQ
jgi:hypothetical protein